MQRIGAAGCSRPALLTPSRSVILLAPVHAVSVLATPSTLAGGTTASAPLTISLVVAVLIALGLLVAVVLARIGLKAYGEAAQRERQLRLVADETRQQAELARERLGAILDSLPDASAAFDREWRWTYVNPAAAKVLRAQGKDPTEVLGKVLWDDTPALVGTPFHDVMLRAAAEKRTLEHTAYWAPMRAWFEQRAVPTPDGIVTYVRDVSERLRAQETKERLAAIVESSDDAIVSKTLDGIIQSWNEGAAQLFGWTAEEAVGKPIGIIVPPGREDEEQNILDRIRHGSRIDHYETVRMRRDGGMVDVSLSISPVRDHAGRIVSAAKIARDISERHRVEEALRDEARLLATLQRIGSTVTAELDIDRLVQLVTDESTALTGAELGVLFYNPDGVRDDAPRRFAVSGVSRSAFSALRLPRATAVFGPTFFDQGVVRSDDITEDERYGQEGPFHGLPPGHPPVRSYLAVPVVSRTGAVLGGLVLGHAQPARFTERHERVATGVASWAAVALDNARLYEAERSARADAQVASRAKSDFLATMSHELRTPLNAISGYAELLAMGVRGPINEQQRAYLDSIQRAQRHLLSLINDVLNFAKIEAGHVHLDLRALPVRDVVGGLEALVAPQLRAHSLRFTSQVEDEEAQVRADAEKTRQVLLNLLSNAIKFSDAGGQVSVRACARNGAVHISVSDTGHGVPADKLEFIFEPFVQLDRSLTSMHEGTGLGLAISRDLARAMGGDLTAISAPGEGSTFTLTLPRAGH